MVGPEVLLFIVGTIIAVAGSYFAAKFAGRASVKVAQVTADEGAYVRAQEIYEKILATRDATARSDEAQRKRLEEENERLRSRVAHLERRVAELERGTSLPDTEELPLKEEG